MPRPGFTTGFGEEACVSHNSCSRDLTEYMCVCRKHTYLLFCLQPPSTHGSATKTLGTQAWAELPSEEGVREPPGGCTHFLPMTGSEPGSSSDHTGRTRRLEMCLCCWACHLCPGTARTETTARRPIGLRGWGQKQTCAQPRPDQTDRPTTSAHRHGQEQARVAGSHGGRGGLVTALSRRWLIPLFRMKEYQQQLIPNQSKCFTM